MTSKERDDRIKVLFDKLVHFTATDADGLEYNRLVQEKNKEDCEHIVAFVRMKQKP